MFWADHPPPHFHAIYGECEAVIDILTAEVIQGQLPRKAHSLIAEWIKLHNDELLEVWELARRSQPLKRIDPLP